MTLETAAAWAGIVGLLVTSAAAAHQIVASRRDGRVVSSIDEQVIQSYQDVLRERVGRLVSATLSARRGLDLSPSLDLTAMPPASPRSRGVKRLTTVQLDEILLTRPRLIVSGEAGAGKTVLALQLMKRWYQRVAGGVSSSLQQPVLLRLDSYKGAADFDDWLVSELAHDYRVPLPVSRLMIERDLFTFILDGLDRVNTSYQARCIKAIVAFSAAHGSSTIIVTARSGIRELWEGSSFDYEVEVQPLTRAAVDKALGESELKLQGLRSMLREDASLRNGLGLNPLWVSLMAYSFAGWSTRRLRTALSSTNDRRQFSLAVYLHSCLQDLSPSDRSSYLVRLINVVSSTVSDGRGSIIYPDRIGPRWLTSVPRRIVTTVAFLMLVTLYAAVAIGLGFPGLLLDVISLSRLITIALVASIAIVVAWFAGGGLSPVDSPSTAVRWRPYLATPTDRVLLALLVLGILVGFTLRTPAGLALFAVSLSGFYTFGLIDLLEPNVTSGHGARIRAGIRSWTSHGLRSAAVVSPLLVASGLLRAGDVDKGANGALVAAAIIFSIMLGLTNALDKWRHQPTLDRRPSRTFGQFLSFHSAAGGVVGGAAVWAPTVSAAAYDEWGMAGAAVSLAYVVALGGVLGFVNGFSARLVVRPLLALVTGGRLTPSALETFMHDACDRRIADRHGVGYVLRHDTMFDYLATRPSADPPHVPVGPS